MLVTAIEKKSRGYSVLKLSAGEEIHINVNAVVLVRPNKNEVLLENGVWLYLDDESCKKLAQHLG